MMSLTILFTVLVFLVEKSVCENILIACPVASVSHQIWNYAIAEGLMAKGHNVTMAGPDANMHKESDRYHPIAFEDVLSKVAESKAIDIEASPHQNLYQLMTSFNAYVYATYKYLYLSKGFQQILNYPKGVKFDLIIMDVTLGPCLYPLIEMFGYPPTIGITAFLLPPFLSHSFGNNLPASYLPYYHLNYMQDMSFFQRVVNYLVINVDLLYKKTYEAQQLEELVNEAFGKGKRSLIELERHISLLLCNINTALHYPQPLTPNIIPVGGLHAKPPKQLPQDLKKILDNSADGVILIKLRQTVLWKFESDIGDLPKNVVIRRFLPQNDILAHPNIKLFITHGGGLSTLETAYHGVPVLGIPFFVDQYMLTNAMVEKGLGLKLEFPDVTTQNLLDVLNELLNNKKYTENIKEVSRRMKDQSSTPLETAVFWAEYAIRHNGTQHLNPKSRDMSDFVSSSLDVVLFLLSVFMFLLWLLYFSVKLLYRSLHNAAIRNIKKKIT
ncbi:hypothetical protein NQ315_006984 [Exocentrus adspersus]|uniref:UDP-glucuronosyltransferase n=1 Tax=Exocentrus adspersus TaxID=1586481 RepID=A0AAV8WC74_9CUCU|nr:hypothetical protein NQ315_006984 [Exocentrus adspersus]